MLGLAVVLAIIAVLIGCPDTGAGRWLRRWLVVAPALGLNRLRPGRLVFYALLAVLGIALTVMFEMEGLRLFGMMLPDALVWFAAFDVGVFIDALLIASTILASNGLRMARTRIGSLRRRAVMAWVRRTGRARRPIPPKRPTPSSTDDDRPAGWIQPAYRAFSMA